MERRRDVLCHLAITLVGLSLTIAATTPTYKPSSAPTRANTSTPATSSFFANTTKTKSTRSPSSTLNPTSTRTPTPTTTPTLPLPLSPTSSLPPLDPPPSRQPTPPTRASTFIPPLASNATSTTDAPTADAPTSSAESVAPSVAGDRRVVDENVNTDVMIAAVASVACLVLLTIVLVVVCVRRRKRGQKPTPATPSTGHRDTAAEDVYTVNDDDNYEIVQSPMATYHPELPVRLTPFPYLELSAPGPGSSSCNPETLHWEPEGTPKAFDGGASGGEESRPEIHSVVHHACQKATELCLKDNELYGQIPCRRHEITSHDASLYI